jgi:hypothetical protein
MQKRYTTTRGIMGLVVKDVRISSENGEVMETELEPVITGSLGIDNSSGGKTLVLIGDNKETQALITEDTRGKTLD